MIVVERRNKHSHTRKERVMCKLRQIIESSCDSLSVMDSLDELEYEQFIHSLTNDISEYTTNQSDLLDRMAKALESARILIVGTCDNGTLAAPMNGRILDLLTEYRRGKGE